jgi:NADPH2:quinone reductase
MRAVVVREYGGPEVLRLADLPEPEPGPGEVTVTVAFAGVNFTDVRNRIGDGLGVVPFVPGVEVAGTVRRVGDGVTGLTPGQPVASLTRGHGYAEVVRAAAGLTVALPENLAGRPEAGGMLVTVPLALMLLRRVARVLPEETVLLHGAAGGVGTVTGQLGRHWGLRPLLGTASTAAKAEFARGYGYSQVFSYADFAEGVLAATAGRGVDVVLDRSAGRCGRGPSSCSHRSGDWSPTATSPASRRWCRTPPGCGPVAPGTSGSPAASFRCATRAWSGRRCSKPPG